MKTMLGFGLAILVVIAGCGGDESPPRAPVPQAPAPTTQATAPAPAAAARKLITKTAMATSPENLVVDPDFQSLWTAVDETGYGIYEAFANDARAEVRFVALSPAGPEAAALTVTTQGSEPTITLSVLGGPGPLSANVWVSAPTGEEPDVQIASLVDSTMVSLTPDSNAAATHGDVRWVPYRATLAGDLPGSLYFSIAPRGKKPVMLLAPEVIAAAHKDRHRARSAVRATSAVVRGMRGLEALRASHTTMSMPPRLFAKRPGLRAHPILR